jgi:hypothetical protein
MLAGGKGFLQGRLIFNSGDLTATSHGFVVAITSTSNLAFYLSDDQSYLQGGVAGACNIFELGRTGNVSIPRGDLIVQNRNSTFFIRPGRKSGASNASWTEMDPDGGLFVWDALDVDGPITGTSKSFRIPHPV